MAAVIGYLLFELVLLAAAEAYPDAGIVRAAVIILWTSVFIGVVACNPPYCSRAA